VNFLRYAIKNVSKYLSKANTCAGPFLESLSLEKSSLLDFMFCKLGNVDAVSYNLSLTAIFSI